MANKTTLQRLKLDPYFNKTIDTNLNVWSHDQNSYEIKFEFYDHQCDKPIDLTGADMRILLDHQGNQPKIFPLEIESKVLGLAKFIMPEQIRGCEGKFTAHIYADYPNRTHDFGSFTFYTQLSRIDGDLGGCMDEIYVSEFETALEDIKKFKVDIDKEINGMQEHFDGRYDKAKVDVEEIEQLINNNQVATKIELGNLDDFREFESDVITKMKNEFTERSINVKWFGAKGDGLTDDTDAIYKAIEFRKENKANIFFPPGIYNISRPIKDTDGPLNIIGSGYSNGLGKGATTINITEKIYGIELHYATSSVSNLTVKGNKKSLDGIYMTASRSTLRDIEVHSSGRSGIKIGDYGEILANTNLFEVNHVIVVGAAEYGIHISGESGSLPDAGAGVVSNVDVRNSGLDGIYVNKSLDTCFYNPVCQHNKGWNIRVGENARGIKFFGFYTEATDTGEFKIDEGAEQTMVLGNRHNQRRDLIVDEGYKTFYIGYDQEATMQAINQVQIGRLDINDDRLPRISGRWSFEKLNDRSLQLSLKGTSEVAPFRVPSLMINTTKKGNALNKIIRARATLNMPTEAGSITEREIVVPECETEDFVIVKASKMWDHPSILSAYIKENGKVTVRLSNNTGDKVYTSDFVASLLIIG